VYKHFFQTFIKLTDLPVIVSTQEKNLNQPANF